MDYMIEHKDDFEPFVEDGISLERYVSWLRKNGTHAGNDAIVAFAKLHHLNVVIHQLNQPILTIRGVQDSTFAQELHIAYHNGEHYSSVRRIDAKPTVYHDGLSSAHAKEDMHSHKEDQSSHQSSHQQDLTKPRMRKTRSQVDIEKLHTDSQRKTKTSLPRSHNQANVPKLNNFLVTHYEVKETVDKQTLGSFPRDKNSLGQKTLRTKLRDENSLGQKAQKGILRDEKSFRHIVPDDSLNKNPTNSWHREDKTLDENYHYTNRMTMEEFLDYFNSQDMTVLEFMETEEFWEYCISNSMTGFNLVNELKRDPRIKEREEKVFMDKWLRHEIQNKERFEMKKQKEIKEKSSIQREALDSRKPNVKQENKLGAQHKGKGKSDIPGKQGQDSGQNEWTQSMERKIVAGDGESSVDSQGLAQVHRSIAGDGESSVNIKDLYKYIRR